MKKRTLVALQLTVLLLIPTTKSSASELRKETLDAWSAYVASANTLLTARVNGSSPFLWADEDPARLLRLKRGEVEVAPVSKNGSISVPHGLIHDWIGAVFIPDTTIDEVSATLRDYGRYKELFPPTVVDSHVIEQSGEADRYSIRWNNKVLFVNAGVDAECRTEKVHVDDRRFYTTSNATRLQEIENYGKPNEHDLPPDQGSGYVWRLYSVARYEQRDGGVYLEIEAIALTRDIPGSLRFLVAPEVKKLSRNSLVVSLRQSRAAVHPSADPLVKTASGGRVVTRTTPANNLPATFRK